MSSSYADSIAPTNFFSTLIVIAVCQTGMYAMMTGVNPLRVFSRWLGKKLSDFGDDSSVKTVDAQPVAKSAVAPVAPVAPVAKTPAKPVASPPDKHEDFPVLPPPGKINYAEALKRMEFMKREKARLEKAALPPRAGSFENPIEFTGRPMFVNPIEASLYGPFEKPKDFDEKVFYSVDGLVVPLCTFCLYVLGMVFPMPLWDGVDTLPTPDEVLKRELKIKSYGPWCVWSAKDYMMEIKKIKDSQTNKDGEPLTMYQACQIWLQRNEEVFGKQIFIEELFSDLMGASGSTSRQELDDQRADRRADQLVRAALEKSSVEDPVEAPVEAPVEPMNFEEAAAIVSGDWCEDSDPAGEPVDERVYGEEVYAGDWKRA